MQAHQAQAMRQGPYPVNPAAAAHMMQQATAIRGGAPMAQAGPAPGGRPMMPGVSMASNVAIPPANMVAAATAAAGVPAPGPVDEIAPATDVFDVLNARQLASHRFVKNHDWMASILDPWSIDLIVDGSQRKREAQDTVRASKSILGVAGVRGGPLTTLACTSIRMTPTGELVAEHDPSEESDLTALSSTSHNKNRLTLDERRKRLEAMQEQAHRDKDALNISMTQAEANFAAMRNMTVAAMKNCG
ncbi:hypothetical protein OIO90_001603 [Microbotryomycetes sp. JL221]|nr:hypothetical protein OIO90_001603 [Microbotryomycetes sp. JL221]